MPLYSIEEIRNTNKDIIINDARPEDAHIFVDLVNKQYLRKKDEDYFFWMFKNTCLPTRLCTAYDKGIARAFYGIQIHKLDSGVNCSVSVDIIAEESYRGRGLFFLLEEDAYKFAGSFDSAAMTVFGNYNGMYAHKRLGTWKSINKIDTLIFDCKNELLKTRLNVENSGNRLTYFLKDDNYRKWRYELNPVYNYDKVSIDKNIFTITKIFEDPKSKVRYGDIVDLECDLHDPVLLNEMVIKSSEHLLNEKVDYITIWALPHTLLYNILKSIGFSSLAQERYFCLRTLKHDFEKFEDIKNWHLAEIDSEVY